MKEKEGTIYIIGTPIGNYNDITLRAIETLKSVDYILCEDTRKTSVLLKHFNIEKKLVSYYKDVEKEKVDKIILDIKQGFNIGLVTDAGMPCISDPGAILVNECIHKDMNVEIIPGVTAVTTAFAKSGLLCKEYIFYGFIDKYKQKKELEKILNFNFPVIIYESPHRIKKVLKIINELDNNRYLILGREITKKFETFYYGNASQILENEEFIEKGEFVLIIDKNSDDFESCKYFENMTLEGHMKYYLLKGYTKKDAIKQIAKDLKLNKNEVYSKFLDKKI